MMNLDADSLLASLLIGLVGAAIFVYGRRQSRLPHMVAGSALVIYPYFVSSVGAMVGIGVGLVALLWAATRVGL